MYDSAGQWERSQKGRKLRYDYWKGKGKEAVAQSSSGLSVGTFEKQHDYHGQA